MPPKACQVIIMADFDSFHCKIYFLQKEQEGIKNKLAMENRGLSWDDTRQMPFTSRVY